MSENLSEKQFPKKVYASDDFHSPYAKKLKSKWIPTIVDAANKWRGARTRSDLQWHMDNHHGKQYTTDEGKSWGSEYPDRGDMNPNEYHEHLHATGNFKYGAEHEHFTPKNKR